jgi:hypothetical protein
MLNHDAMKLGAPHSQPKSARKCGFGGKSGTDETDSPEAVSLDHGNVYTEPLKSGDAVGHKPLPARFVDGRNTTVRDRDFHPVPSCR